MAVRSQAIHTSGTYLYHGTSLGSMSQLVPVKSIPALGSEPSQIEVTDLSAEKYKSYIAGLQDLPNLTFTANYTPENFAAIDTLADKTIRYFQVRLKKDGDGVWTFKGSIDAWKSETEVDAAHEFSFAITLQGGIKFTKTAAEANSFETYKVIETDEAGIEGGKN